MTDSSSILGTLRNEGKIYLDTDASIHGLSTMVFQEQDGQLRILAYASKNVITSERNYCTIRKSY